jgi:hypothetical protein
VISLSDSQLRVVMTAGSCVRADVFRPRAARRAERQLGFNVVVELEAINVA